MPVPLIRNVRSQKAASLYPTAPLPTPADYYTTPIIEPRQGNPA